MMSIMRTLRAVALLAGVFGALSATAQTYPSRPIKVIVPYPPGGNTDLVGRLFAQQMSEILANPIVIDNRGGVSGTVGVAAAARAEADGYTLLHATNSELAVMPAVQANSAYDPVKDLTAISTTCTFPFVLVTRKSLPVQTIDDLVAIAGKNRGTMTFASVGAGSANHLILEPFKTLFGIDVVHVPYKGGGPAANDLMGGHVDAAFATLSSILPLVPVRRPAGAARHQRRARAAAARCPERRRTRPQRPDGGQLERVFGAGRHIARDRRPAQRRDREGGPRCVHDRGHAQGRGRGGDFHAASCGVALGSGRGALVENRTGESDQD
jgi:tripartite-type tricarboxylate transporter receptor subunit TctC